MEQPYLKRIQEVLDGVPRGPVGPPGPLELAVLNSTIVLSLRPRFIMSKRLIGATKYLDDDFRSAREAKCR
jgi:hypothetical protein